MGPKDFGISLQFQSSFCNGHIDYYLLGVSFRVANVVVIHDVHGFKNQLFSSSHACNQWKFGNNSMQKLICISDYTI